MQPKEMEHLSLQLEKMFLELQNRIMRDVVRRIKKDRWNYIYSGLSVEQNTDHWKFYGVH